MKENLIILLSLLCTCAIMINAYAFNFTVICMDPLQDASHNTSFLFTPYEENLIFSAMSVATIVMAPAVPIVDYVGLKMSFSIIGLICGIATIFMHLATLNHLYLVMAIRFFQGLGINLVMIAQTSIPRLWGKPENQAWILAIMSLNDEIAPILAMVSSSLFCTSSFGWPGMYYLYGMATVILFLIFMVVYPKDRRRIHPSQSTTRVVPETTSSQPRIPYKAIFTSPSIWGFWSASLGFVAATEVVLTYGPTYINKTLHFNVTQTGFLSALPFLLSIGAKLLGGTFLDKVTCIGEHQKVLVFTTFAQGTTSLGFLVLALFSKEHVGVAQVVFTTTTVLSGMNMLGRLHGCQVVSQQYSHIVATFIVLTTGVSSIIYRHLIVALTPNYAADEWAVVFYGVVIIALVSQLIMVLITKVEPAPWTKTEQSEELTVKEA